MSLMTFGRAVPVALVAAAVVAATSVPAMAAGGPMGARGPVKPGQYFTGRINGSNGRPQPVAIRMACFGAITPGETGHPMSGQTVAVLHAGRSSDAGHTGRHTTSIGAFFGVLPPSTSGTSYVDFTEYGQKAIPTSMTLPCAGTATVTFLALPLEPGTRSYSVPVTFVGQP